MKYKILLLISVFFTCVATASAQDTMHDSVDVVSYDLCLDIGNKSFKRINGTAEVAMRLVQQVDSVELELTNSVIDSVLVDGTRVDYRYAQNTLHIPVAAVVGDTVTVTVHYDKGQLIMMNGWGGFYFDDDIYYNLGIAIYSYPHNVGKTWFPCRDNFYDKATYRLRITAKPGWRAICSGVKTQEVMNADMSLMTEWFLAQPTPTYLVGVAVAPFHVIERSYQGLYGSYPATIGFINHDSSNVWTAFDELGKVLPMYERCFGPYRWDRVGYVSTTLGSMEHAANIAFTTQCMSTTLEACLATMSHEFAHSWFGNLITCATSGDMWINEGGASFCEELAIQAICPEGDSLRYIGFAEENLFDVLCQTHVTDKGFKPLYGQSPKYTYGSTVYDKGATVWHSLRGYMGDSLFYASLRTLFERCAFGNIDSYQLRDSLSLYSGIDLTDFFNFHVFTSGFCDFEVDSLRTAGTSTTVYLRQKSYGTDTLADGNKVWVTFVSEQLQQADRLVTFDGEYGQATFTLPFTPVLAIVDYHKQLSKGSIGSQLSPTEKTMYDLPLSLFKTNVKAIKDYDTTWLYVTHHWSKPDTCMRPRILKMADHYWRVTGVIPEKTKLDGRFFSSKRDTYSTLDENLYSNAAEFANVRLLYRAGVGDDWYEVASTHTGNYDNGYFVVNSLMPGEYTLALVDTSVVDNIIEVEAGNKSVTVYPNPSSGRITIENGDAGEPLSVTVYDKTGRIVVKDKTVCSGQSFDSGLPTGSYVFLVLCNNSGVMHRVNVNIKNF